MMTIIRLSTLLLGCFFNVVWAAQACVNTISPTSMPQHYQTHSDGTISDTLYRLMWSQCSVGQDWQNGKCAGQITPANWEQANELAESARIAGYSSWRLPTVHELSRITELRCQQPAVDLHLFPNTPAVDYWTSTPFSNNPEMAWLVHFGFGENHTAHISTPAAVRLVRSMDND